MTYINFSITKPFSCKTCTTVTTKTSLEDMRSKKNLEMKSKYQKS